MNSRRLVAFLGVVALASPSWSQLASPGPGVTEELICERPAAGAHRWPPDLVGSDLQKVAWISETAGRHAVIVNGAVLGPAADDFDGIVLSPDGQHVLASGRQQKAWFVWLDGVQHAGPFDEVKGAQFTPDGRVVYAVKRAKAWTWVVDGKDQPVTSPDVGPLAVARDRVAYATRRLDGWRMVVDGQIGPPFESVLAVTFSPDGSRLAYLGLREDMRIVAVVDGTVDPPHDTIQGLRFSADSKHVGYLALDTRKAVTGFVVADGVASPAYPALIQNAHDTPRPAFLGADWVASKVIEAPFVSGAASPQFRPDGMVVYAGRTGVVTKHVVLDDFTGLSSAPGVSEGTERAGIWLHGSQTPLFEGGIVTGGPAVSEEGGHVGWVEADLRTGTWFGVVDGERRASAPGVKGRSIGVDQVVLSRDGARLAFVLVASGHGAMTGLALRRVVTDGVEDKACDALEIANLRFSEDGKHLAYEVQGIKGEATAGPRGILPSRVVLDGVAGPVYSVVVPGTLRFVGPTAIGYVVRHRETGDQPFRYYRVTQTAPPR